jgi:hypothetical protein
MDAAIAREMLKWAAGPKTFPVSRLLTNPKTPATLGGLAYAGLGAAALGPAGLLLGAPGAAIGYGLGRLARWFRARGLASRTLRGGLLTGSEELAVKDIVESKIKKASVKYPISEFFTSRVAAGVLGGAQQAASGLPPIALVTSPIAEHISRAISARALRGRLAQGGKALYPMERRAIEMIKEKDRSMTIAKAKKVLAASGLAAVGAGATYAGVKALSGKDE